MATRQSGHISLKCVSLSSRHSHYSSREVSFSNSWMNSAEYVSAVHFHSNLVNSAMFISPLPGRLLQACTSNSTNTCISGAITYLQPGAYLIFCPDCQICTSRRATVLLTLLTSVMRRTKHCISSPRWVTSTASWVGQTHIHHDVAFFFFPWMSKLLTAIMIVLSTRWDIGAYVEKCHVFSEHEREWQRDVDPSSAGSSLCHSQFTDHHQQNDYELLRK